MDIAGVLTERGPYSPTGGALSIWARNVYQKLDRDVTIYSRSTDNQYPEGHVKYIEPGPGFYFADKIDPYIPYYRLKKRFYARQLTNEIDGDILHIHNRPRFIPILRKEFSDSTILLHMHNDHLVNMSRSAAEDVISEVDAIIGVSDYVVDRITGDFPHVGNDTHRVYNGVDIESFRPARNTEKVDDSCLTVLYVGRLAEEKGVHLLIKAMERVIDKKEDVRLRIVGASWFNEDLEGEYYQRLRAISSDIRNNIEFTGYISHDNLINVYQTSDICVVPSVWNEPFGLVVAESMASGLPTIVTERGGPSEIVDDAGIIVDPENISELSGEILCLINDSEKRSYFGRKARKRINNKFTWDHTANNLSSIINQYG